MLSDASGNAAETAALTENAEQRASNAAELVAGVRDLVSLPDVYLQVRALVNHPDSSLTDVANVIAHDPGLSARILKLVNSAFFGLPGKVETITRAVSLLGMGPVHDLALATSVSHAFNGMDSSIMSMDRFWKRSIHCGVVGHQLSMRSGDLEPERMFVAGLLRDVGHLVMYQQIPDLAAQALTRAQDEQRQPFEVERELIGFDYVDVGCALMQQWDLPDYLAGSVRGHLQPTSAQSFLRESAILHIASYLIDDETPDKSATAGLVASSLWERLGLSPDAMPEIDEDAKARVAAVVELLTP